MATEGWVCPVTAVAATGDVTQLYPAWVSAGVAKAASTNGQLLRRPLQGALHSIQIQPNGSDGGTIEIYDIDGGQIGADVSSLTAITNTQLAAAITAGNAKLIFQQTFAGTVGSGVVNAPGIFRAFMKGLAARFSNAAGGGGSPQGLCTLNLVVSGGYEKVESRGGY